MVIMRLSDHRCRQMRTARNGVVIAILTLLASVISPGQCQSGSTNFLQLFLETADELHNSNSSSSITINNISPLCLTDLKLIHVAVNEHSMWATKCEWSISSSLSLSEVVSNCDDLHLQWWTLRDELMQLLYSATTSGWAPSRVVPVSQIHIPYAWTLVMHEIQHGIWRVLFRPFPSPIEWSTRNTFPRCNTIPKYTTRWVHVALWVKGRA